jgi:hypothetical protein
MASEVAIARLRRYLGALSPSARTMLAAELERALMRGEEMAGASFVLEELRREMRQTPGAPAPRAGHPQRLFFAPVAPFLIDQVDGRYLGRVPRVCLDRVWLWLCRDVMPAEAKTYSDDVSRLLAADQSAEAEQVARTFQDVVVERVRETLAAARSDEKATARLSAQIGLPDDLQELRDIYTILRSRDALAVVASRLPAVIGNLADHQLDNVKALLDSPVGSHPDVFLYALILVMGRLAAPWQLIRLAVRSAGTDAAIRLSQSSFARAVDVVIAEMNRAITALRNEVEAGRMAQAGPLVKEVHDSARALHTEIDLSGDLPWGRALGAARSEVAELLQGEIETIPGRVRRLLRLRRGEEASRPLDSAEVDDVEAALELFGACRTYASELALSELTLRVQSELQNFFDSGTQILIDGLRSASPLERPGRESQVDAAVRFCGRLFGAEYATLLGKAADLAGRDEARALRA